VIFPLTFILHPKIFSSNFGASQVASLPN